MNAEALAARLADIVGISQLYGGSDVEERYCTDILRKSRSAPGFVVRPGCVAEVSEILRLAHAQHIPVTALGGNTGLVGGAIAEEGGILLSLERLNRVIEVDSLSMTATAEAGVSIEAVQNAVAAEGLILPLDLGSRGSATVGGAISTNAGGTRVLRWGMMRDMVLGLEAVLADGTIVSSLGKSLKDNAGYDWKHLLIGTEGTLGIITQAVLRLRPAPRSTQTALVATETVGDAARILRFLQGRLGGQLSSFELMWRNFYEFVTEAQLAKRPRPLPAEHGMFILIEALGDDEESDGLVFNRALEQLFAEGLLADAVIAQSDRQRQDLWAARDDLLEPMALLKPRYAFDVSMAISAMEQFVGEVEAKIHASLPEAIVMFYGHGGDGNLHVAVGAGMDDLRAEALIARAVYESVRGVAGSISAEHGIGRYKRPYISFTRSESELQLMRTIKRALDPAGILNPGKVIPDA